MGNWTTIDQALVTGKRVIVRVDWNVTFGKALEIIDDTRIRKTLTTIEWLLAHNVQQIVLMSHLGKAEEQRSIAPVVDYAARLLGKPIMLIRDLADIRAVHEQIVMLENLRLWEGEEKNDPEFARHLASLGDIYVNEAFGESHRAAASIVGIPALIPHYAGLWFSEEVTTLLKVRANPERPYVVVMGGAKVADKSKLLEVLSQKADTILLGGKLANEYIAKGLHLTGSARVITPSEGADILDIGIETQRVFAQEIAQAKTVVWNGPMGKVEEKQYRAGTQALYDALVENEAAYTVVGGGDTLAAIGKLEHLERIDHVSTGGGAMLKLLEAGTLPGIKVLN